MFDLKTNSNGHSVMVRFESKAKRKSACPVCGESTDGRVLKLGRIVEIFPIDPGFTLSEEQEKRIRKDFRHIVGKTMCGECL